MASTSDGPLAAAELLTYGAPSPASSETPADWPDYPATFGLTAEHVGELCRMVRDPELNAGDPATPAVWAPVHAWRALAQLGATEAAEALTRVCLDNELDDWVGHEVPEVFRMLGPATLPVLARGLGDDSEAPYGRITLVQAVKRIAESAPDARERGVAILHDQLAHHARQDAGLNGFLIHALVELGATQAVETIRAAFAADAVDTMVMGDVEDAEIELGLRDERDTPRPENPWTSRLRRSAFKALKNEPGFHRDARRDPDAEPAPGGSSPGFPFDKIGDLSDGAAPPTGGADAHRRPRKVGRNEPCPCGSGKKAKACCGAG